MVAEEALQIENSKMIFDPTDMAFYRLPEGINDDNFIKRNRYVIKSK